MDSISGENEKREKGNENASTSPNRKVIDGISQKEHLKDKIGIEKEKKNQKKESEKRKKERETKRGAGREREKKGKKKRKEKKSLGFW